MRILVADDHLLYREAAALRIQRLFPDAQLEQVTSLDEAWQLAEQPGDMFDLFLVDFHMPGMSNEAITRLVGQFPDTPVAVISGTAQNSEIRAAIQSGARGFIPKTAT